MMNKILEMPLKITTGAAVVLSTVFALLAAVTWLAARDAILFVAPIVVYVLAFLSLVLLIGLGLICFAWLRLKWSQYRRDRKLVDNEGHISDLAREQQRIQIRASGRLLAATVRQVERGYIHPSTLADTKFSAFPAAVVNKIEQGAVPLLETATEQRRDLLPAIANSPNILIVGGKGRGKTELMKWLEYERLNRGERVTVLDSHSMPGQWGGQVIGAGRKYQSIAAAMIDLDKTLDRRYKQRTAGKEDFSIINTFIDEFTLLPGYLKDLGFDIQQYSKPALTEGRKVGMNCVWGIHSDRAEALGLKGAMDLLECFDAIVYLKKVQNDFYTLINFGEGVEDIKYNHPGPFTIQHPSSRARILELPAPVESVAVSNWPRPQQDNSPTTDEQAIIEAVKKIKSERGKIVWSAVTGELGWTTGGPNNNRIKTVLDKHNIDY